MGKGLGGITGVVRGGFWLYGSNIMNNVFGFTYWMVISSLGGSGVLGFTSAVVGVSALIAGILGFGVSVGLQRFLGSCWGDGDKVCLSRYFWSCVFFALGVFLPVSVLLWAMAVVGFGVGGFSSDALYVLSLLVALGVFPVFRSFLISLLRTDILFIATLVGNLLKFVVGLSLVLLGWGWVGAALGYAFVNLAILITGLGYAVRIMGVKIRFSFEALVDIVRAGVVSWFPSIVVLAGQWLGVLAVFGSLGASATGHYYVAFAIANVVVMVGNSMLSLLLPVLSGMRDGRKRAASHVVRLSLLFMVPAAVFLAVYPWLPLGLLGSEYVSASSSLVVLLLGSVPLALTTGIWGLVYAYGRYGDVLLIGLAQNVPRVALYFVMVPWFGGLGAALSFTVGAFSGFVGALFVARRVRFDLGFRSVSGVVVVPAALGGVAFLLGLHWLIGLVLVGLSYVFYARLGLLRREDVREVACALLSEGVVKRAYELLRPLVDWLFP